jgi:hypothetical protein
MWIPLGVICRLTGWSCVMLPFFDGFNPTGFIWKAPRYKIENCLKYTKCTNSIEMIAIK